MCKQSLARKALGSLRCQCFGRMRTAGSEAEQPQDTAGGKGAGMAPIALVAANAWLVILFFSELLTFLMAENGNAEALPTSLCTSWINTHQDTTQHNARSNCWLQFAMVSSIKPFQHFTNN